MIGAPSQRSLHANEHCRHYSYRRDGGPTCAVGIDLATGNGAALKCMPSPTGERCGWREEFTDDERTAWEAWRKERVTKMIVIMAQIPGSSRDKKNRPEWGKSGSFACPACTIGTVLWARARVNGHVHAACSTPDCFEVME